MEPITDPQKLLHRMKDLFSSIDVPGLEIQILDVSYGKGTVDIEFDVSDSLANQLGFVQGGIVATMLDACIGIAGATRSGGTLAMPLAEMKTTFLRPASVGKIIGRGETLKLGRKLAFIEASLLNEDGELLAKASGTACPVPFPEPLPKTEES
jgi:uncharacterized protein (TIGR00369 family)